MSAVCLGVPGRISAVDDDSGVRMGSVDFGGVRRRVCLAYVPEAEAGDYVVVHVGFAIGRLDEAEALSTLRVLRAMGDALERELDAGEAQP